MYHQCECGSFSFTRTVALIDNGEASGVKPSKFKDALGFGYSSGWQLLICGRWRYVQVAQDGLNCVRCGKEVPECLLDPKKDE